MQAKWNKLDLGSNQQIIPNCQNLLLLSLCNGLLSRLLRNFDAIDPALPPIQSSSLTCTSSKERLEASTAIIRIEL